MHAPMKIDPPSWIEQRPDHLSRTALKRIVISTLVITAAIGAPSGAGEGKVPSKAQQPQAAPTPVKVNRTVPNFPKNVQPTVMYYFDLHFLRVLRKFFLLGLSSPERIKAIRSTPESWNSLRRPTAEFPRSLLGAFQPGRSPQPHLDLVVGRHVREFSFLSKS